MTKRTLVLRSERLTELTEQELTDAVAAAHQGTQPCVSDLTVITDMPTIPDVNRCPTLFC